jgi:cytochrome c-type protein NapC
MRFVTDWWHALLRLNRGWPFFTLSGVFLFGVVSWGGFNTAMEVMNTEGFCISCHEMREFVYQEYIQRPHYNNGSGVRATCPDCHVPKAWTAKFLRKIHATNELFHKLLGSINTREKFLAKRMQLATYVWDSMRATDSRECRNCHGLEAMKLSRQSARGQQQHNEAKLSGATCIDCHKGIAHALPEEFLDAEHERFENQGIGCGTCHKQMARPPPGEEWE